MMSINKQHQVYQKNSVNTASSGKLTLMLYNGCIKFINQAIKEMNTKDYEAKNTNIKKAQNIIQELMVTLDQEVELSQQLLPLYDYTYYQLQDADIKNDVGKLEEALSFVTDFRDTWKEVLKETTSKYAQGTQI